VIQDQLLGQFLIKIISRDVYPSVEDTKYLAYRFINGNVTSRKMTGRWPDVPSTESCGGWHFGGTSKGLGVLTCNKLSELIANDHIY
jgi:hypothetical protein